jgi:hypothetical protein
VKLTAPRVPDALLQATAWTTWVPPDATLFSGGGNLRPAEPWTVIGAVLDTLGGVFGESPQAGRPTTRGGALPPQVTLAVAGRRPFSFQRTGEDALLEARYLPRIVTGGIAVLAGLCVVGLGWILARRGKSVCLAALAVAALAIAFYPSAAPGLHASFAAITATAALLAVLAGLVSAWRGRWKGGGTSRRRGSASTPAPEAPANPEPPAEEKKP